jgi:hypothetical protein
MNVYDCAIKIQRETKTFFEGLEAETNVPELKHLFSLLAAAEGEFMGRVVSLKSCGPNTADVMGLDGAACSFKRPLTQRELVKDLKNDPDLFNLVVREEEQEIEFYDTMASAATDDMTRTSLLMLAAEARKHLEMVENIYEFVEAPKHYLAWGEFSNLQDL